MILASISDQAKHNTTVAALGASAASWLIDHTSLFTAITAVLTGVWLIFCMIERGQRIYFNWRYGPNARTGSDE